MEPGNSPQLRHRTDLRGYVRRALLRARAGELLGVSCGHRPVGQRLLEPSKLRAADRPHRHVLTQMLGEELCNLLLREQITVIACGECSKCTETRASQQHPQPTKPGRARQEISTSIGDDRLREVAERIFGMLVFDDLMFDRVILRAQGRAIEFEIVVERFDDRDQFRRARVEHSLANLFGSRSNSPAQLCTTLGSGLLIPNVLVVLEVRTQYVPNNLFDAGVRGCAQRSTCKMSAGGIVVAQQVQLSRKSSWRRATICGPSRLTSFGSFVPSERKSSSFRGRPAEEIGRAHV